MGLSYDIWREFYISDIIEEISMGPFGSNIKVDCFVDEGIPVLNGRNLGNVKLREDDFNYVTVEKSKTLGKAVASREDVIITHRGTLGQISFIPNESKFDRYVISQSQFRVRCNKNLILPIYFVYYFKSPIGQYQLLSNKSQVGVPALARPTSTFKKLSIRIPSVDEQKAIADTLSCLDEKIELNNRINKNLEEMAQAIFKHWFVDFEFPDENGNPYKSSGGEMVESELGLIPKGWEIRCVGDIGEVVCGKTPSTKDKLNFGGKMPFVTIPDMHSQMFIVKTERYLSEKGANTQKNKILPPNSICVSCIATAGLVSITTEKSQTNQQINSIICREKFSYIYCYFSMKLLTDKIKMLGSSGSTTNNLNKTQFSKIKIVKASDKELELYHKYVIGCFEKIKINLHENIKLEKIRDTLLPKLMSGEIRVPTK